MGFKLLNFINLGSALLKTRPELSLQCLAPSLDHAIFE